MSGQVDRGQNKFIATRIDMATIDRDKTTAVQDGSVLLKHI